MKNDKLEEEFRKFKNGDAFKLASDAKHRFLGGPDVTSEYQAWLYDAVSHELFERLSGKPQTWPELMKDFPGPWLPGREAALGLVMKVLATSGALIITKTQHRNGVGFEWEESRYSINALHRLAAL